MNFLQKVNNGLHDELATFKWFERAIAIICICIPIILRLADNYVPGRDDAGFRSSISDYVYMDRSYIFGMLLTTAAMMFIFNGAVYFKNESHLRLNLNKQGKWYNVVLGLSLLFVILLPYKTNVMMHYTFAGIFFVGNALVTAIFFNNRDKKKRITLAILTILSFAILLLNKLFHLDIFPWLTYLWAEWLSLTVIAIHFILESIASTNK